ncbi:hypothetical protein AWB71_05253 [Caballeronia peredens]|nr:hypothetical protein AWB71_05253 [Caballeronia peredens]
MQHRNPELVTTNASVEQMLGNAKNITLDDVHRVYFMVKEHRDTELKLCYDAKTKNRTFTFYKGSYHEPSFKATFQTRREAYEFIIRTYGTK